MKINNDNIGKLLKEGENEAYHYVYRQYYPYLCEHANRILKDFDLAKDISQKTILILWEKKENVQENSNILGYLLKAVHNNSLNYIRDEGRKQKRSEDAYIPKDDIYIKDYIGEQELQTKIDAILQEESEQRQTIFKLNRFEGYTAKEISEKLNVPAKTVEYNIAQVMKKMHEQLKDYLHLLIIGIYFLAEIKEDLGYWCIIHETVS
ncbi:MAG: sigma-70 family RNA polymerase sigma factor [Flavobacteriales bacterium]|nr:sigma-70 family RNA polymerase sigma factor [Flavobacteriales bacterium]